MHQLNTRKSPVTVRHIDHLNMTVRDLRASLEFYRTLFGFEVVERGQPVGEPSWAIVRSGDAMLCLYEHPKVPLGPKYPERPRLQDVRHFALRIVDGTAFVALLAELGIEMAYGGPVRWPHSTSYYISDPTGHQIEVVLWDDDQIRFDPLGQA
jgi:catechol 2,3-dioxygenase-like lactoylglutathione lyase family enzyme